MNIFRDQDTRYYRALLLDEVFPPRILRIGRIVLGLVLLLYLLFSIGTLISERGGVEMITTQLTDGTVSVDFPDVLHVSPLLPVIGGVPLTALPAAPRVNGFILIVLAAFLTLWMMEFYRRSFYYDVEALLERGKTGAQTPWTTKNYETCSVLWGTEYGDLLRAFAESPYGGEVLARCGISRETTRQFLKARKTIVDHTMRDMELRPVHTLRDLGKYLTDSDPDFYQFLFELGIRDREFVGAIEWVERSIKESKRKTRFWGRVALGQSPAFGADFAYGGAYRLGKYATDLSRTALHGGSSFRFVYGSREIEELEIILSRAREANALLVGEEGSGMMDVILDFSRDIMNGYAHPSLAKKRVMVLHAMEMAAHLKTKSDLETETLRVLKDSVDAGNVILVIEDLPGFIETAAALGSDVIGLLDPFLGADALQIIGTADLTRYHSLIERSAAIMKRFEVVTLSEPGEEALIRVLENAAESAEKRNPIRLSYPAIVEIARSADKYLTTGVMPDKALDLLAEIVPWARARLVAEQGGKDTHEVILVKKLDVLEYVRAKTQIPVGEIDAKEREKLVALESLLRDQVVGQEDALRAVADALRRSRAGVRSENRPIGAFLFLGPTGVGKTETAKALARVFFGAETALQRLDMSEYQGEDGLMRMIGTQSGEVGALPRMLDEHPYGVLLLDEFEKTNVKVLDLFLQIFDEGVFHDAIGKKVNGRNTIFIATSNAGADIIRSTMEAGIPLADAKKDIIDRIISSGKYKPELINRFDGVVLFHPLAQEHYQKIAVQMLEKLRSRLREQSLDLIINQPLIDVVMAHGVDPAFGARPMARAVQDIVEKKVAEKIIGGNLSPGSPIEFSASDFDDRVSSGGVL